ncbi:hypothetical protein AURDEDRAFT_91769 [Auricularia subglabra TFB-10046 SS5]|nr:hypothetical protein AURDEDRAFT_91769 [Auricularia subglabra TFB-10046 SS5]
MFSLDSKTWPWKWHWPSSKTDGYEALDLDGAEAAAPEGEGLARAGPRTTGARSHTALFAVASLLVGVLVGAAYRSLWQVGPPVSPQLVQLQAGGFSTALALYTAQHQNAPSSRWAPMVLSSCTPNMHPYHAPCMAATHPKVAYGEELVYPDFRIREPVFAPLRFASDRPEWQALLNKVRDRTALCPDDQWACYRGISGQNIIVANSTYAGIPRPDMWTEQTCMGGASSIVGLKYDPNAARLGPAEYDKQFPTDRLVIATSPDSWSFQHFLDRVTHVLVQGAHLNQGVHPEVVVGRRPPTAVQQMWEMLGFKASADIHYNGGHVTAKSILFSCRAPLIHPYTSFRTLEAFGLIEPDVPLTKRKTIMYCSRTTGKDIKNGGRRVLNEAELLNAIRALLSERGQAEDLVIFNQEDYGTQPELMRWFHNNVRAIIGPHGGALFNHRWTGPNTLLLEMMPASYTSLMFWEEASILGQVYANMILPANGTNFDADIPAVIEILREHLGKPDARGPSLDTDYRWHGSDLQGQ